MCRKRDLDTNIFQVAPFKLSFASLGIIVNIFNIMTFCVIKNLSTVIFTTYMYTCIIISLIIILVLRRLLIVQFKLLVHLSSYFHIMLSKYYMCNFKLLLKTSFSFFFFFVLNIISLIKFLKSIHSLQNIL